MCSNGVPLVDTQIGDRLAHNIVIVPRSAIRNGNQVLIVDIEDRLRLRTVSIARIHGAYAYIEGGVQDGERVCLTLLQAMTDGARVNVVEVQAAQRAAMAES